MKVQLNQQQRQDIRKLWMIYGNYGRRHSDAGHKFLQRLLDSNEDTRDYWRPGPELTGLVDAILRGETPDLPPEQDKDGWVCWELEREDENGRLRRSKSKVHLTPWDEAFQTMCGAEIPFDSHHTELIVHHDKEVPGNLEKCRRCFPTEHTR